MVDITYNGITWRSLGLKWMIINKPGKNTNTQVEEEVKLKYGV